MRKILPDGLILRSISEGCASDRERLTPFYADVYSHTGDWRDEDNLWTDIVLAGEHPTISHDDLWVVVDPAHDDMIVSATLLIPQTWRYDVVDLPVGRPEMVATHPDYRHRGLIRALMTVAHERSAALGHNVQGITGIPHFYRKFGYSMAVDLDQHATMPMSSVPAGEPEAYTLHPAEEADFPLLDAWDAYMAPQFALSVKRSPALWRYVLRRPYQTIEVIVDRQGTGVGYLILHRFMDQPIMFCNAYIVGERASYLATYADVLRGIKAYAQAHYPDAMPERIQFDSGQTPALDLLLTRTNAARINPRHYAWYMRTASPARLMNDIKPVLEKRLMDSGANRYTGEFRINFYNLTGLRLVFEQGCLAKAEDIAVRSHDERETCEAAFPWESFLSLVFGYRTFEELHYILPDCLASGRAETLFSILFPKKPARLFAI